MQDIPHSSLWIILRKMKASHVRAVCLRLVVLIGPLAAVLFAGCGSRGTLYGTVAYKGKPVPKATIAFLCSAGAVPVTISDSEGNYRVSKVPLGQAKVSVQNLTQIMPAMMGKMMAKQKDAGGKDAGKDSKAGIEQMMKQLGGGEDGKLLLLPERANDPERSGIAVDVLGGAQEFNIVITD
jgi:hypothetical protein